MPAHDIIDLFDRVAREFAARRTQEGALIPGILRLPRPAIREFADLGRAEWESRHWTIHEPELQALRSGDESAVVATLKRLLNATGVAVVGTELAEAGTVEIVPVWEREIGAYLRELPNLVAAGESGNFAVIADDRVVNVWDTYRDAAQYGYERFGEGKFMAQRIDARDAERFAAFFGQGA